MVSLFFTVRILNISYTVSRRRVSLSSLLRRNWITFGCLWRIRASGLNPVEVILTNRILSTWKRTPFVRRNVSNKTCTAMVPLFGSRFIRRLRIWILLGSSPCTRVKFVFIVSYHIPCLFNAPAPLTNQHLCCIRSHYHLVLWILVVCYLRISK